MSCRSTSTHSPSRAPSVPSGRKPASLALSIDAVGDRADVTVGVAGGDDHGVRDVGQPSHIQHLDVDCFHVVERGRYDVLQRRGALAGERRGRVRVIMCLSEYLLTAVWLDEAHAALAREHSTSSRG